MVSTINQVDVIILQHPSEVKQSKATVPLLLGSLNKCHLFVGENFEQEEDLQSLLCQYRNKIALLYPSDKAEVITERTLVENDNSIVEQDISCIVLLDGTWKKAYRLFQLNTFLHDMKHFALSDNYVGQYHIRKTKKTGALSTLEACCYALSALENCSDRYTALLDNFVAFNQFQQRFIPI
ncbi:DTW domain-containing protein [Thalassotalea profundi]|uniref:tRNA-uridine aminocarboxypropyltransferase n=2 Tax=Thalassotalea profundi TaxID=2036687 RepID=A0ABQ3J6B1_9GAMM|nr:DTW domain-containing protein [Thalassotalea profundi]